MEENDREDEFRSLTKERIAEIDKLIRPPSKRAEEIYYLLRSQKKYTTWDIVCFCIEYLALQVPNLSFIEPEIRKLSKLIYLQHYVNYAPREIDRQARVSAGDQLDETDN
jgi:hypothetical protein